jgi:hypothetical protein
MSEQPKKMVLEVRDDHGTWYPVFDQPETMIGTYGVRNRLMMQGFKVRVRPVRPFRKKDNE